MTQTAVLNLDYSFLGFVSWKRALSLVMTEKVEVVRESDQEVRYGRGSIKVPLVIKLMKMVRVIYKREVPFSKKNVFTRDGEICQYCGKKLSMKANSKENRPTLDHVLPTSRGGESTWENSVTACSTCNIKKANKTPAEARMALRGKPYQPTISEFLMKKMRSLGVDDILRELFSNK